MNFVLYRTCFWNSAVNWIFISASSTARKGNSTGKLQALKYRKGLSGWGILALSVLMDRLIPCKRRMECGDGFGSLWQFCFSQYDLNFGCSAISLISPKSEKYLKSLCSALFVFHVVALVLLSGIRYIGWLFVLHCFCRELKLCSCDSLHNICLCFLTGSAICFSVLVLYSWFWVPFPKTFLRCPSLQCFF